MQVFVGLAVFVAPVCILLSIRSRGATAYVHLPAASAVIITGGAGGIGRGVAEFLAKRGFTVFVTVRKTLDVEKIRDEGLLQPVLMDVTKPEQHKEAFTAVAGYLKAHNLNLAALVNNAGINPEGDTYAKALKELNAPPPNELADPTIATSVFDTNVVGMIRATHLFLPLLKQDRGRVVLVGSYFGTIAGALKLNHAYYEASKFAIEGLADSMRRGLRAENVAVSLIKPGNIATGMNHAAGEAGPEVLFPSFEDAISSPRPRARYYAGTVKGYPVWFICRIFGFAPDALTDLLL